jgi:hypothetical protein
MAAGAVSAFPIGFSLPPAEGEGWRLYYCAGWKSGISLLWTLICYSSIILIASPGLPPSGREVHFKRAAIFSGRLKFDHSGQNLFSTFAYAGGCKLRHSGSQNCKL